MLRSINLAIIPLFWVMFSSSDLAAGAPSTESIVGEDIFRSLAGKWAWNHIPDQCSEDPHYISFSADRKTANFRVDRPFMRDDRLVTEYSYEIRQHDGNTLTMSMHDETRRTATGVPVVWVLILKDPKTYTWHRTDWESARVTPDVIRCD